MKRLARIAVLAALAVALYVASASRVGAPAGCWSGCATAAARTPGPLRVLSMNVLHGFPDFEALEERLELIAGAIRAHDADLVLLQEVPWTFRLGDGAAYLAGRTGLNHASLRANGNRWTILFEEGAAILSRFPLDDVAGIELRPRAGFFEHRVVLYARVETSQGRLDAFSTHLTNGDAEVNRGQVESLRRFVESRAGALFVVGGDFNAHEDSPQIRALAARWTDAWRAAHPDRAGPTCCADPRAGPEERPDERIDFVFVSHQAAVRSGRRVLQDPIRRESGWLRASDHLGLLAELEVLP